MKRLILIFACTIVLCSCSSDENNTVSIDNYESLSEEIEALKAQVESLEQESVNSTIQEDSQVVENIEQITYEKELLGEFEFSWDDNNIISLNLYKQGDDYFVEGNGIYETDKLLLLQENYYWMCEFTSLYAKEAEIDFTVGDEEYKFLVSDYQVIADTIPMENWDHTIPSEYYGEKSEYLNKIMDFYDSTIWGH